MEGLVDKPVLKNYNQYYRLIVNHVNINARLPEHPCNGTFSFYFKNPFKFFLYAKMIKDITRDQYPDDDRAVYGVPVDKCEDIFVFYNNDHKPDITDLGYSLFLSNHGLATIEIQNPSDEREHDIYDERLNLAIIPNEVAIRYRYPWISFQTNPGLIFEYLMGIVVPSMKKFYYYLTADLSMVSLANKIKITKLELVQSVLFDIRVRFPLKLIPIGFKDRECTHHKLLYIFIQFLNDNRHLHGDFKLNLIKK